MTRTLSKSLALILALILTLPMVFTTLPAQAAPAKGSFPQTITVTFHGPKMTEEEAARHVRLNTHPWGMMNYHFQTLGTLTMTFVSAVDAEHARYKVTVPAFNFSGKFEDNWGWNGSGWWGAQNKVTEVKVQISGFTAEGVYKVTVNSGGTYDISPSPDKPMISSQKITGSHYAKEVTRHVHDLKPEQYGSGQIIYSAEEKRDYTWDKAETLASLYSGGGSFEFRAADFAKYFKSGYYISADSEGKKVPIGEESQGGSEGQVVSMFRFNNEDQVTVKAEGTASKPPSTQEQQPDPKYKVWAGNLDSGDMKTRAMFSNLWGEVTIRRGDDEDSWELAEMDTIIYEGDYIRCEAESGCTLSFADMTSFTMKEKSTIICSPPEQSGGVIKMIAGVMWGNIKSVAKTGRLKVDFHHAALGCKGTIFVCEETGNESITKLLEGAVEVTSKITGETVLLKAGEMAVADASGKMEKSTFDIWQEAAAWGKTAELEERLAGNEKNNNTWIWIVVGVVAFIGVAVVVIVIVSKKKKPVIAATTMPYQPVQQYVPQPAPQVQQHTTPGKFCAGCGTPLTIDVKFCSKCGAKQ